MNIANIFVSQIYAGYSVLQTVARVLRKWEGVNKESRRKKNVKSMSSDEVTPQMLRQLKSGNGKLVAGTSDAVMKNVQIL